MPEVGEIRKAKELGKSGWMKFIWHACETCGKARWVHLVKGEPVLIHCAACAGKLRQGGNNGRWKGGLIDRECINCAKPFTLKPSRLKTGRGKYCSTSCELMYQLKNGIIKRNPTKPEILLSELFQELGLPFRYVGGGEIWLGNRNPDFINTSDKKQVIELFGSYWHTEPEIITRTEHFKQHGFETLIIWDSELKDIDKVIEKVKGYVSPSVK